MPTEVLLKVIRWGDGSTVVKTTFDTYNYDADEKQEAEQFIKTLGTR